MKHNENQTTSCHAGQHCVTEHKALAPRRQAQSNTTRWWSTGVRLLYSIQSPCLPTSYIIPVNQFQTSTLAQSTPVSMKKYRRGNRNAVHRQRFQIQRLQDIFIDASRFTANSWRWVPLTNIIASTQCNTAVLSLGSSYIHFYLLYWLQLSGLEYCVHTHYLVSLLFTGWN